jgi:hypothetical protein
MSGAGTGRIFNGKESIPRESAGVRDGRKGIRKRKKRHESEEQTRAKSTLRLNRQTELQTHTECYIYARV